MIQKLRRRLTLIFGLLTSLVLVGMLAVTCHLTCTQYLLSQEVLYQTQLQTLTWQLQQNDTISESWLSQVAQEQNAFYYVELGGVPLHYSAVSVQEPEREELLNQLRLQAEALGMDAACTDTQTFTVKVSRQTYRGTVCTFASCVIYYAQDLTPQYEHLKGIIETYVLLGVVGIAALLVISTFLVRLSLRPTEQALQEQQDFVAAASHELRSPLTVIRASLYTVQQKQFDPQLETADREAERMGRLVGDLLTLAGSGGGHWSLTLKPVELDTLCIQLYEQFQPQAEKKHHPFQLLLPDDPLPVIQSDGQRLIQLLSVLLSNAFDHTPEGTEVTLSAKVTGRWVQFAVTDHGQGIPDREKEAIFRRFYRSDQSRTDKQHFGLGLAIAQELSMLLGGKLTVQDTPGGGASFLFKVRIKG